MPNDVTIIHIEQKMIHDVVIDPDHTARTESSVFRKAKDRLKEDGHYRCFICDSTEDIQIHHFAAEYMSENIADLDKVKEFVETFDIYGYGKLLKNQPLESIEDVRCLMVLCQTHIRASITRTVIAGLGFIRLPSPRGSFRNLPKMGRIRFRNQVKP